MIVQDFLLAVYQAHTSSLLTPEPFGFDISVTDNGDGHSKVSVKIPSGVLVAWGSVQVEGNAVEPIRDWYSPHQFADGMEEMIDEAGAVLLSRLSLADTAALRLAHSTAMTTIGDSASSSVSSQRDLFNADGTAV